MKKSNSITGLTKTQPKISQLRRLASATALTGLIALAGSACRNNPEPDPPTLKSAEAAGLPSNPVLHADTIFPQLNQAQRQRYQPDLRLTCFWDEQGWLIVYAQNASEKPIHIEPANFGVIINGRSYPYNPASSRASFPITQLQPGEMATGRFHFPRLGNLLAQHLYFRHPQTRSSRCLIRQSPE